MGQSHFDEISPRLHDVDTLVLNGDIFDFRWAIRPHTETIPAALDWLSTLRNDFPHLDIHFIPGNHDCLLDFTIQVGALDGISQHSHHLILGRNIFLHGDAASYRMDHNGFQRFRSAWEIDRPCSQTRARLYDLSDALKLSDWTHRAWFRGDIAIRRIIWHLEKTNPEWQQNVDQCYFGHTHIPIQGIEKDGIRFHNTGSAIRGMDFVPLEFNYQNYQK